MVDESDSSIGTSRPGAPFDGRRFRNLSGPEPHGLAGVFRWMLTRNREKWPANIKQPIMPVPVERVDDGTIRSTVIGHSTVLIQVGGLNILTDPMLSDVAGPLPWLGVRRSRPPALRLSDMPSIDVVLLSHNHYDHLDRATLAGLALRDNPVVITGLRVGRSVPSKNVVELDWWQSQALPRGAEVTYVPAEHFSARGPFDRNASLWGGFVLRTSAGKIYFAGDTGHGAHFEMIHKAYGAMDVSFIPIGAYEPRWFMGPVHIDPTQAVAASIALRSQVSIAIHHGTFPLADEAVEAPARELEAAIRRLPHGQTAIDFRMPIFGQAIVIEPIIAAE